MRYLIVAIALFAGSAQARPISPADTVFRNGYIYTVDVKDSVAQALAVKDGRIIYVGDEAGAKAFTGRQTQVVDLKGRMIMPGLIDGHMHPQSGGLRMLNCNLNYESLTIPEFQTHIQKCVDDDKTAGPDDWLQVINWFEQGAKPAGTAPTRAALDGVKTTRPIKVHSSFGHSNLTNTRGLQLAGITRDTPDPKDGVIVRDASGEPTGLLQDAAQDLIDKLVPPPSVEKNYQATQLALKAMREQGITTFLDAYTDIETMTAYRTVSKEGGLTARAHFAVLIDSPADYDADKAIAEVLKEKAEFAQKPDGAKPVMTVDTAKLFLDGVYSAPAFSAVMVEPYFDNGRPGHNHGPKPYFSQSQLNDTLIRLAAAGINPHMHADGDGSVRMGLNAVEAMRRVHPGDDIRPAIAHDEIVDPSDYKRYAEVGALPVLSFQWARPSIDIMQSQPALGPVRSALMEPAGLLEIYGARIVYGSDWPVDALDEWLALQIAVTRKAIGEDAVTYPDRLGIDPGLTVAQAVRAITLNAAYSLRQDRETGSLETGKFADLIVLDRNLFQIKPEEIGATQVLMAMVGGKVVYRAAGFK
ncbi:amidohydrolase [Asticcacaulis sp.]|uniref:amidohydrolase n=1 Tax=Asticcacaulis sp. TaxID=1872648 RepID=UPI002C64A986|nr:amidohydrolase [Asticcacaulis sp.]HTM81730.1 amidohydrolase [Asticcacaulis sp.]